MAPATMAKHQKRKAGTQPAPATPGRVAERLARHPAVHVAIVALVGALAYANTLHVPFVFDDEANIVNNPGLRGSGHLAFSELRYVGLLTFAWNYAWGGLDPFGYHLVNLAIHLASAIVVYGLVATTLRTPALAPADEAPRAPAASPWLCALLFVAHPIQTQAVTYTVQRLASLATLFYLLAVLAYARARLGRAPTRRAVFYVAALAAAVLATKTKEIAFTLPAAIALYELCFLRGRWRRWLAVLPFAAVALLIPLALLKHAAGGQAAVGLDQAVHAGASSSIPRAAYLLTQPRVIVTYLRLLCLPVAQNLDYDFRISRSAGDPAVIASALLVAALLGAGLLAYLCSRRDSDASPRLRLLAFGAFWFFLALAVESSVVPLADVIFEHRLYLPSFGAFLAAAVGFATLQARLPPARAWMARVAMALVVLALAIATHARNSVWGDDGGLWLDVLAKSPNNARAHNNAGNLYFAPRGRVDEAIGHFQTALRLRPGFAEAHANLGIAYERQGRLDEAVAQYEAAIRLSPHQASAHNNLGGIYLARGRTEEAVRHILAYVRLAPEAYDGYYNLALAYQSLGRKDDALTALIRAAGLNPRDADVHAELARLYLEQGRNREASAELRAVVSLRPESREARAALDQLER